MRDGNTVDTSAGVVGTGLLEGVGQDRGEQLHVGAAGEFRHHSAIASVQVDLTRDHRGDDGGAALHDRGGCFVA